MRTKYTDLVGAKFNQLTVVALSHTDRAAYWHCRCECGKTVVVPGVRLRSGKTKSCGCRRARVAGERAYRHGGSRDPRYASWSTMMQRCYNEDDIGYHRYGGRGIAVCERWHEYTLFAEDMGARPVGTTLDRRNNDGNYEPGNCWWRTPKQQGRNRKNNRLVTYAGETLPVTEWAERFGLGKVTLSNRLDRGWEVGRALTAPTDKRRLPKGKRKTDGSTTLGTKTVATDAAADPVVGVS